MTPSQEVRRPRRAACTSPSPLLSLLLAGVRYLLSALDTAGRARLDSLHIEPVPIDQASLVTGAPVYLAAASAYAASAAGGSFRLIAAALA